MKKILRDVSLHKFEYILLGALILISGVIRFTPIIRGDTPFLFDHGRDMLAVKQIVIDHKLTLIGPFTGLQGVFQSPLHFYLLAIPFILTGGNPLGGTAMMAILSLVGILLCYLLGKKMIDPWFGLLLALFFAFSPTSLAFSAHFWNPHWIPFLMILFYYFLYKSIFASNKFLPWVGLITGLIAQFEVAFGLPLFISLLIIIIIFKIKALKSFYFWSIIPVFIATFLPQMLFDVRHQFLMTKTIMGFLHGVDSGTGGIIPFNTRLSYRINEIQLATIFSVSNNNIVSYILCLPIVIFLFGAPKLKMKKELKIFGLFVAVPVFFFFAFLIYPHEAWSWYWIGLQTSYYCIIAFVLSRFVKDSRNEVVFASAIISLWIVSTVIPEISTLNTLNNGDTGTLRNELRVIDYVYHDANHKRFGEFVYTPPIYDYAYQYLFWWKAKQYHYSATKDKTGIFYLIIEPDKEHPYAINGWKETVIKSGKILWDKKFPGNITVEKRTGKK